MLRQKNEIKHFTELGHIWWGAKSFSGQKRYGNRFLLLKKLCHPKPKDKILEIGCGDGELTKRLAKLSSKIYATDITPALISRAKKEIKGVNFKVENAEKIFSKDNTFDIVCGMSILHHINYLKSLEESFRVLKKGGRLFFSEPNYLNPIVFSALHSTWLKKRMEYSPDETALIRWEVDKILHGIGFSKVKVFNYDFMHPSTPKSLTEVIESLSTYLEKTLFIKEMSGSIIIWAEK